MRSPLLSLVLLMACPGLFAVAQEPTSPSAVTQETHAGLEATTRQALENLATQLGELRQAHKAASDRGDNVSAAAIAAEEQRLRWQFAGLAAHFDVQQFEAPKAREFDLKGQLEQLLRPLVIALKDATEEPRLVADLRAQLEALQQRQQEVEKAIRAVEATRDALPPQSPARAEAQRELDDRWKPALDSLRRELLVTSARLQSHTESQRSVVDGLSNAARNFVQSSGLSLLLSALVFIGLFFGMRFAVAGLLRRRARYRAFSMRLLEVVLQVLTLLIALAGTLAVPYVRNDWLLLAIGIVFLVGAGWALMRVLPLVFEQMRLVLNVGGVREGERLLIDGLPYRVDALRFQSRLCNPDLEGGELRVPIKDLIGRRSRRATADEPWFPCRQGDVVALTDGVLGRVRQQTPEVVVVAERFDAPRSYATTTFLQLHPRNLSRGFCIAVTFGIDHMHREAAVTTVPERLQADVSTGLIAAVGAAELTAVRVELQAAAASTIDFAVLAEFRGSAAERYRELERLVHRLLLAACLKHGYRVPFPQLMVHRAAD